jgi:chromosomal replication initiation ATPase DnaA
MHRQLTLDLAHRPALGREDFLVTPSNAEAVALVDQWPQWPGFACVISGAPGCGKTHLGEVWRQTSKAIRLLATDLTVEGVPQALAQGALLLEDVAEQGFSEAALFHALNHARQTGGHILITARSWPLAGLAIADLVSRLQALPVAHIRPPDDALLRGVLVKQFADRQIAVDEALVGFLVARMPRDLDALRQLVARIDAAALEQRAEVTRPFVAKVLAGFESPDLL